MDNEIIQKYDRDRGSDRNSGTKCFKDKMFDQSFLDDFST